jgi:hypothetical protein
VDQNTMNSCNWEAIHEFDSLGEFKRFCAWSSAQIDAGVTELVPVVEPSPDLIFGLEERWYRCKESGEIWRLITPDFPFRGLWEPVDEQA